MSNHHDNTAAHEGHGHDHEGMDKKESGEYSLSF